MGGGRDDTAEALARHGELAVGARAFGSHALDPLLDPFPGTRIPGVCRYVEWTMVDEDLVCRYVWHNLPDPTGGTARYTLAGTEILRRDGGEFETLGEFRNGDAEAAMLARWRAAGPGGCPDAGTELRGIVGWAPEPRRVDASREEIERAFGDLAARLAATGRDGDWAPVVAVFTDDVRVRDHVRGFVEGRHALGAWIRDGVGRSSFERYAVRLRIIDGTRVSVLLRVEGAGGGVDVNALLHYAGDGLWAYVEVVYDPREIRRLMT